jgi:ABC-2 type transport system permease protein
MFRATWIIFQKEMQQYFVSPVAYLIAFGFLLVTGLLFNANLIFSISNRPLDPALVPRYVAATITIIAPLLTMRLLAEERRESTLELLLTAPVSDSAIVFGKFMGAWVFFTVLLLVAFSYQFVVAALGQTQDMGIAIASHIGIWLYGGAAIAIGMVFSALTENQIVAGFLASATLTLLYSAELAAQIIENLDVARIAREISLPGHFTTSFAVGLVRGEDIVYYAGIIVVMLYISMRIVEAQRVR